MLRLREQAEAEYEAGLGPTTPVSPGSFTGGTAPLNPMASAGGVMNGASGIMIPSGAYPASPSPNARPGSPKHHGQHRNGSGSNGVSTVIPLATSPRSSIDSYRSNPTINTTSVPIPVVSVKPARFTSPLFRLHHAPLLRVFVPSPNGAWLSDDGVLECEKELKRAGIVKLLRPGDVIWDTAVLDEGNAGRLVWDGNYLIVRFLLYNF